MSWVVVLVFNRIHTTTKMKQSRITGRSQSCKQTKNSSFHSWFLVHQRRCDLKRINALKARVAMNTAACIFNDGYFWDSFRSKRSLRSHQHRSSKVTSAISKLMTSLDCKWRLPSVSQKCRLRASLECRAFSAILISLLSSKSSSCSTPIVKCCELVTLLWSACFSTVMSSWVSQDTSTQMFRGRRQSFCWRERTLLQSAVSNPTLSGLRRHCTAARTRSVLLFKKELDVAITVLILFRFKF